MELEIFIGKWINEGYVVATPNGPSIKILTSDVYEWMPGNHFVLHTAFGRIGGLEVGGTEILGRDETTGQYFSHFYDSQGNVHYGRLTADKDTWTWSGETTGCTAVFTEHGKVQTAHHVRRYKDGRWLASMEVVLTKVA